MFRPPLPPPELRELAINTIRMLAIDAVEKADSGHPGFPMGAAPYAFTLWYRYLRFNPQDPAWPNRDRFILSAGHGSMLLYALLHLNGFLPLEEIRQFRQFGSKTPGHPEQQLTPGVETTTGPLGQGFANGVGMAIAAKMAAARYNTAEHKIIDHYIYGIVSDGDLMEGVSAEAASLAGHLQLGNLIYFYDDNHISIEGPTELTFTEDRAARFRAYNWHVIEIDGNDCEAAARAIEEAQAETSRPSLIIARTVIGYGAPHKANTAEVHGAPLGKEEVKATKENLGWPQEPLFYVPDEVRQLFAERVAQLQQDYADWQREYAAWAAAEPKLAAQYEAAKRKELPHDLEEQLLAALPKPNATRRLSGVVMQRIAELVPYLVGGAADLAPSTSTWLEASPQFAPGSWEGRNLRFGVREHAMGAIANGIALYGGFIPFTATFLVFADYMRPPIRLANLMKQQVIHIFTHDSIFLGEDGPTHQPVEQLASLRLIPGMTVIRPADGPEVAAAWAYALRHREGPTALILTRQSVPAIERETPLSFEAFNRGAYIVSQTPDREPDVVIVATGSELQLGVAAKSALEGEGYAVRLVSMPSRELFERQDARFQQMLIPDQARKVVIEAAVRFGWADIVGRDALMITQDDFGHSAPYKVLAEKLGFTGEQVARRVLSWLRGI
ncbi:MAG: transketolase [Chloroflexi bacterium]|nr:transketolase [Chloroflexota bacterium]